MGERFQSNDQTRHWYASFDPLLGGDDARSMVDLCHRFGSYKMYSEEPTFEGFGSGYPARYDAIRNFIKTGGRFGRSEPLEVLAARTNYFRESYAYGDRVIAAGVEPYLHCEGFIEAARALYGKPVIVPAIVYANVLVPGQELAIHTDVPEYRGINRQQNPQWLIVAMHHSGLFEDYRMPIATGVAWYHDCEGGEFAFYPNGPEEPAIAYPVRFNTAVLLDTDSVFHGVDRVRETDASVDRLRPGMRLVHEGDRQWVVRDGQEAVTSYRWQELRFSISWKAYCFADDRERQVWESHGDDLRSETVVDRMVEDLQGRGVIGGARPSDNDLVEIIIDSYIRYPAPAAPAGDRSDFGSRN